MEDKLILLFYLFGGKRQILFYFKSVQYCTWVLKINCGISELSTVHVKKKKKAHNETVVQRGKSYFLSSSPPKGQPLCWLKYVLRFLTTDSWQLTGLCWWRKPSNLLCGFPFKTCEYCLYHLDCFYLEYSKKKPWSQWMITIPTWFYLFFCKWVKRKTCLFSRFVYFFFILAFSPSACIDLPINSSSLATRDWMG